MSNLPVRQSVINMSKSPSGLWIPKGFDRYGLVSPAQFVNVRRRLVMTLEAETGCGKSDFMLRTAPRPLLVVDLDRNLDDVITKYEGQDGILVKQVAIPPTFDKSKKDDQARDYKLLMEVNDLIMDAIAQSAFRSIFIDTGDPLYELARRGILGGGLEFGDVKRTDFSAVNSFMKAMFDAAKSKRANFCMSLHMTDEYKGANGTGKRIAAGWKKTTQCSQLHLRLYKDKENQVPDKFHAEIVKCNANSDLEGFILDGEDISFRTIGQLVFPQSDESDWEDGL